MARTRYIKPGFFHNDRLAELGPWHRLLFAGLWTIADRSGRLEDRPKRIKGELFPYDDVDVDSLLSDLAKGEDPFVIRYEVGGVPCLCLPKWSRHQKPHANEAASVLPSHRNVKNTEEKNEFAPKSEPSTTKERTEHNQGTSGSDLNENVNENSNGEWGTRTGTVNAAPAIAPAWSEPSLKPATVITPIRNHAKCFDAPAACARGLCLPRFLGEQWQAQIGHGQPDGFSASGATIARVNAIVDAWPVGQTVDDLLPWWRQQWKFSVPMGIGKSPMVDWFEECKTIHGGDCLGNRAHYTRKQLDEGRKASA